MFYTLKVLYDLVWNIDLPCLEKVSFSTDYMDSMIGTVKIEVVNPSVVFEPNLKVIFPKATIRTDHEAISEGKRDKVSVLC